MYSELLRVSIDLLASQHAVQYLGQSVIIYCKNQHSSQCCNWKLNWSCKYTTFYIAATEGILFFSHLAFIDIIHRAYFQVNVQSQTDPEADDIKQEKSNDSRQDPSVSYPSSVCATPPGRQQ